MSIFSLLAQVEAPVQSTTTTAATQPVPAPWWANSMFPLIMGLVILYFFIFRNKRGGEKKREGMLSQLKKGDKIQTIGGIIGTVLTVDDSEVLVKVDETSNTKIRFSRNAIHRVLSEEKSENK